MPAVAGLKAALEELAAVDPAALPDAGVLEGLEGLLEAETLLRAVQTRWLAAADARAVTVDECGRATRSWLVEEQRLNPGEAARRLRLARGLASAPATEAALRAGDITAGHAQLIVDARRQVPAGGWPAVEDALVALAKEQPPFVCARAVDTVLTALGVESAEEAYARRYGVRGVALAETFGGTGSLAGTLTPEVSETLRVALDAASQRVGPEDERTLAQRYHDGLGDIAAFYLAHADLADANGERPRVVVTIPVGVLLGEVENRFATLDSGIPISAATARRIACDAEVLPAVLGAKSEVLDLGRTTWVFTAAIRRAARLRDGNRCAHRGCRRPVAELHHIRWWTAGGTTSLENAAWLCRFHHWLVHEGGWSMARAPDGGYVFAPPGVRQRAGPRAA